MLKNYLKIAGSIIASVLVIATAAALVIGIIEFISGTHKYESIIFPFLISGPLLLVFGVPGSIIWWAIARVKNGDRSKHIIAAIIATLTVTLGFAALISKLDLKVFFTALGIIIFIIPVATISLFIYYKFGKSKK